MVEVIPVLDIRDGSAVSGQSGNRDEYKPLKTVFASSSNPIAIAKNLPYERLYVADLNGIVEGMPDLKTLEKLSRLKSTLIDPGVRTVSDLDWFDDLKSDIVLGTETVHHPELVLRALERFGERVIISIDVKDGSALSSYLPSEPVKAYSRLSEMGVKRAIFLNISAVGTENMDFSFIKDLNNAGEIFLGGGITKEDLKNIRMLKVDGVLVGTALHKGLWK